MTTENPRARVGEGRNLEIYRPTPIQYFIGGCWAVLLVLCWRRASLALAVAAALVLSPIVWIDYFALAAVPLAVVRPRL